MPIREPGVSLNVTPLYAIVNKHEENISRGVQVHENDRGGDVLAAFGRPDAPRIGPTSEASRIERWLGPDSIRGGEEIGMG